LTNQGEKNKLTVSSNKQKQNQEHRAKAELSQHVALTWNIRCWVSQSRRTTCDQRTGTHVTEHRNLKCLAGFRPGK